MMITVKLFAMLESYLPAGSADNQARMEVAAGATPEAVFRMLNLPAEACHLVLVNGVYVAPSERGSIELQEDDALAAWPPVAGGAETGGPVTISKDMGVTHAEFFRVLPRALGPEAYSRHGARVVRKDANRRLEITLGPEATRQIALLRVPTTAVTLSFSEYSDDDRAAALALFDRAFQRAGG